MVVLVVVVATAVAVSVAIINAVLAASPFDIVTTFSWPSSFFWSSL